MTEFILNDKHIRSQEPTGMSLLNYIREKAHLKGTKSGCKEGDCGACTVMIGELKGKQVQYKTVTSCLFPLGNAHGKHVVTIEGLSKENDLSFVQQSLADNNATQCGFCTPGIVTALNNYLLNNEQLDFDEALNALAGNICRCTGYKSIERAARQIVENPEAHSIQKKELPDFFTQAAQRLSAIAPAETQTHSGPLIAGGTDLLVQKPDEFENSFPKLIAYRDDLNFLNINKNTVTAGGGLSVSEFMQNRQLRKIFPELHKQFLLISSEQIRNMATLAGNIVNASPIGDISIFLLALDARLIIKNKDGAERTSALKNFFKAYKDTDIQKDEIIYAIEFNKAEPEEKLNFEKVSKRQYLDIASVNSCLLAKLKNDTLETIRISAGGIGPVPFFAEKTCKFLSGKKLSEELLKEAAAVLNDEINPISDIRGSEKYKRLLLRQLFLSHFYTLFPEKIQLSREYLISLPTV